MNAVLSYTTALAPSRRAMASRRDAATRAYVFNPTREFSYPALVPPSSLSRAADDAQEYEGYTQEQFMVALEAVSPMIAERAEAAKAKGRVGKEEARRRMREALDAGA